MLLKISCSDYVNDLCVIYTSQEVKKPTPLFKRITYLGKNQIIIATSYHMSYSVSFLSLFIYSCIAVSYLCKFIQSDVPSSTLLLIPNEFGTVFELGEMQYSQAPAKTGTRNNLA